MWSKSVVVEWLRAVKMPVYIPVFKIRNVDGAQLIRLAASGRAGTMAASKVGIEPVHHVKMIALVKRELKYATFSEAERNPDSRLSVDEPWKVPAAAAAAGGSIMSRYGSRSPPPSPELPSATASGELSAIPRNASSSTANASVFERIRSPSSPGKARVGE